MSSDDDVCSESKTDTGHMCGMYMWFVALYIGKFDYQILIVLLVIKSVPKS